jgi:hypothetical protein
MKHLLSPDIKISVTDFGYSCLLLSESISIIAAFGHRTVYSPRRHLPAFAAHHHNRVLNLHAKSKLTFSLEWPALMRLNNTKARQFLILRNHRVVHLKAQFFFVLSNISIMS